MADPNNDANDDVVGNHLDQFADLMEAFYKRKAEAELPF